MRKFWNLKVPEEDGQPAELFLEGEIAEDTWFGDEVTPRQFREELAKAAGRDVTVWINSPGGDVIAASEIYTALMEHRGSVNVKIHGLAASAASVIAMAGDRVLMAPTAYLMIHDPWTVTMGNAEELRSDARMLDEIADGLVLAYQIKTGLSRGKIKQMMADETWMSARTAVELGFADGLLTRGECDPEEDGEDDDEDDEGCSGKMAARAPYGRIAACARLRQRIAEAAPDAPEPAGQEARDDMLARMQQARARLK